MEVWFPDGNGGRKLVNMAGNATNEEESAEVPALQTKSLSRAAPLLASTDEGEDETAREIYYPDRDGGRVLLSSCGGITSLPTASQTVKGAVMIGAGLSMAGDTLNVSLTSANLPASLLSANLPVASTSTRGVVRVGNGLSMTGDVLNVTLQGGGGGNYSDFTGATGESNGTAGLVPAPLAGEQNSYLCGNGTWTALTTTITIGTTPSTVDGAVWFSI